MAFASLFEKKLSGCVHCSADNHQHTTPHELFVRKPTDKVATISHPKVTESSHGHHHSANKQIGHIYLLPLLWVVPVLNRLFQASGRSEGRTACRNRGQLLNLARNSFPGPYHRGRSLPVDPHGRSDDKPPLQTPPGLYAPSHQPALVSLKPSSLFARFKS